MNIDRKKCCVIGGCGFIGSRLICRLCGSNRVVTVVGRRKESVNRLPSSVRYVSGDCASEAFTDDLLKGVDEVIYLAYTTVPGTSYQNPLEDIITNLPVLVTSLKCAAHAKVERFVLVSSGGTVYGKTDSLPISEEHSLNPICPYGITKMASEKYALSFYEMESLPIVIVRPGNAYGEGQIPYRGQGFIATAMASVMEGRPVYIYGNGETVRDYIHVDDVAAGIFAVLERGRVGSCYNIGSGEGKSLNAIKGFIEQQAKTEGLATEFIYQPSRSFDVPVNILNSHRIQHDTGWEPVISFEEGMRRTWAWIGEWGSKQKMRIK